MTKSGAPELSPHPSTSRPWCTLKNTVFSLLFLLPFLSIVWLGGSSFSIMLDDAKEKPNTVTIMNNSVNDQVYDGDKGERFMFGVFVMILASCLWAVLQVVIALYLITGVIKFIFVLFILFTVFGGVLMFADENDMVFGVTLMVLAVLGVIFFLSVRQRLSFINANLRVACAAVLASSRVIYIAVVTLFLLVMWSICWASVVCGYSTNEWQTEMVYQGNSYPLPTCTTYVVGQHALTNLTVEKVFPPDLMDCSEQHSCSSCYCGDQFIRSGACFTPTYSSFKIILFLCCFYYISLVLAHVVHCSSALVTMRWWVHGRATTEDIIETYKLSFTRYLSPICLGSLLVPPIRTMYSTVHIIMILLDINISSGRPYRDNPSPHFVTLAEGLHSLLQCLELAVISFNRYAFSFLVMNQDSDMDFVQASKSVAEVFSSRGFTSLTHDTVLENMFMMSSCSSAIGIMLLAIAYTDVVENDFKGNINDMLPFCCFVISYVTSLVALQVVQGAAAAMYVCLAINPDALQTYHPQYFEPFVSAWRKEFPEANITIACTSFITGRDNCELDVFPTAYVPPAMSMSRMLTATSSSVSSLGGEAKSHQLKYQMIRGNNVDGASSSDDNHNDHDHDDDHDHVGSANGAAADKKKKSGGATSTTVEQILNDPGEDLDALLESYAASQLPSRRAAPPANRSNSSSSQYDFDDDNEFVL